jgi:Protein of unknown function (DUF4235)
MNKQLYKLASLAVSVLGGMLASVFFKRVWKLAAKEDEAPQASDVSRSFHEVLLAAALQGAIFAVVQAAVERAAAVGERRLTAAEPGEGND